jgi:pimeloyl-ACP methyl ester carboxylesterase
VRVITWPAFSSRLIDAHVASGHKRYYTLEEHVSWFLSWLDTLAHEHYHRYALATTSNNESIHTHSSNTNNNHTQQRPHYILLGHSIGAWLCVSALSRRPSQGAGPRLYDIDHAALLTPFVRRDISLPIVTAFRVLFMLRPLVKLLVCLAGVLPRSLKLALLKLFTGTRYLTPDGSFLICIT